MPAWRAGVEAAHAKWVRKVPAVTLAAWQLCRLAVAVLERERCAGCGEIIDVGLEVHDGAGGAWCGECAGT